MAEQDRSMFPFIYPSDKVIVSKSKNVSLDDIVAFKDGSGKLIAHRVIFLGKDSFITKGDNNRKSDGKISKDQILGVVEKIRRKGHEIKLSHLYFSHTSTYLTELKKIVKSFESANISFIILKGPPVHIFIDKAPAKRLYVDTDVLVKKKDYKKAKNLLIKLGFKKTKNTLFGEEHEAKQDCFAKDVKPFPVVIDLHKEPALSLTKLKETDKLLPDIEKLNSYLFRNTRKVKADNTEFKILNATSLLIYLLLHFYHHNFQGSYRAYAIKNLVKNRKINWKKFVYDVNRLQVNSFVYPSLVVFSKYFEVKIPKKYMSKIGSKEVFSDIVSYVINPFDTRSRNIEGIKRFLFLLVFSQKPLDTKFEVLTSKEVKKYISLTFNSLLQ